MPDMVKFSPDGKTVALFEKLLETADALGSDQALKDKIDTVASAARTLRDSIP